MVKPKSQGQSGAAWMSLPHPSLKSRYWTDLTACHLTPCQHEMSLSFATCLRYDQQGKKREQRQKIAQVQFASILPRGMFEITVRLEWKWNLIKVQTSQAAILFLPRLSHWRFVLPIQRGILYWYTKPSLEHLFCFQNHKHCRRKGLKSNSWISFSTSKIFHTMVAGLVTFKKDSVCK